MIPVYRAEGEAIIDGLRAFHVALSWNRAIEACDALSALLPPQAAGPFRDRALTALRGLPTCEKGECPDCDGGGCIVCDYAGWRTVTHYVAGPDPLDPEAAADILTDIFEEHVTR